MRTIRELVGKEEKVYILLRNKPIRYRFMADAAMEGITYGDGTPATDREVEDIMALQSDGTVCFLGWAFLASPTPPSVCTGGGTTAAPYKKPSCMA